MYVQAEYSVSDNMTATMSGAISKTVDFRKEGPSAVKVGSTYTRSGSLGSSYSFTAKLTGVYNGASPSVSDSITVPAQEPGKVGTPSVSSITSSTAKASWSAPASNGDSIDGYQLQLDDNSSFSSPSTVSTDNRSYNLSGMSANDTWYVRVRAHNSAGWGAWSSAKSFKTDPLAPSTPGTPSVSRNSDTSHTVSWSRVASTARPLTSQRVQRFMSSTGNPSGSGSWVTIATLGSDYTTNGTNTYTDTSTIANRAYRYRIQGLNASGTTTSAQTDYLFTTPAAPTSATATKNSAGNIVVSWVKGSLYGSEVEHEIQESTNGGSSWSALTTVSGSTASYTHVSPNPAVTHTYRVRTSIDQSGAVGDGLTSAFRQTNTVQLAAPPNAPTVTRPIGTFDAEQPIIFTWIHNPIDSSDQTKFSISYRYVGESTWTYLDGDGNTGVAGLASTYTFDADTWENGNSLEFRVRTWGIHATPSPWSASSQIVLSSPPTASFVTPDGSTPVETSTVQVTWSYFDAEDDEQSGWQLQLVDSDDNVVEDRSGTGSDTTDTFTTQITDSTSWTIRLKVRDAAGMWMTYWEEVGFTADFPEPAEPLVSAIWLPDTGAVELEIQNPEDVETVYDWTGTPGLSTSTQTVEGVLTRTNLNPNPTGTVDVTGYVAIYPASTTITQESDSEDGTFIRATTTVIDDGLGVLTPLGDVTINTAGSLYSATLQVRSSEVGAEVVIRPERWSASAQVDFEPGEAITVTGDWQNVSVPLNNMSGIDSSVENMRLAVYYTGSSPVGAYLDIRHVLYENVELAGVYFDGDTADVSASPPTTSIDVYRRINSKGDWVIIAAGAEPNISVIDTIPSTSGTNEYRVVAHTEAGATLESLTTIVPVEETYWHYVNYGPGFSSVLKFWANPEVSVETSRTKELYHFASANARSLPVELASEQINKTLEISANLSDSDTYGPDLASSTSEEFEDLGQIAGVVVYRDPIGRRMFSSLRGFGWSRTVYQKGSPKRFSMTFDEIEYAE